MKKIVFALCFIVGFSSCSDEALEGKKSFFIKQEKIRRLGYVQYYCIQGVVYFTSDTNVSHYQTQPLINYNSTQSQRQYFWSCKDFIREIASEQK